MAESARTAVNADDDVVFAHAIGLRDCLIKDLRDSLHFEIVVAGTQSPHLIALPLLCLLGHRRGPGAAHLSVLLDSLQILRATVTPLYRPHRATGEHRIHFLFRQAQPAGAAEPCRDALVERIRKPGLQRLEIIVNQARVQAADPAGDVEPHAAG